MRPRTIEIENLVLGGLSLTFSRSSASAKRTSWKQASFGQGRGGSRAQCRSLDGSDLQGNHAFILIQKPAHVDNKGDTSPPAACLAERSCVDASPRDQ